MKCGAIVISSPMMATIVPVQGQVTVQVDIVESKMVQVNVK